MPAYIMREVRLLPYFLIYFIAERMFSAERLDWRAWLFDWEYWLLWVLANSAIMLLLDTGGITHLPDALHIPPLTFVLGSMHPVIKQLVLLFAFDMLYYWFHRFQHTTALWPQHAIHHSEPHLNAATASRHHILENLIKVPLVDVPLMFIFVETVWNQHTGVVTRLATSFIAYLGIFAHSNLRIGFGPLNWLLVSPQTHRIHHSIEERHWNRNFAAYFPLLDVVFGTYYHPAPDEYPDTGIPGVGYALNSLPAALSHPFVEWASMWRDRTWRRDGIAPHARLRDAGVIPAEVAVLPTAPEREAAQPRG